MTVVQLERRTIGQAIEALPTPALLVDEERLSQNLQKMAAFFAAGQSRLRPHVKSHKCSALALRQIRAGAIGITAATVEEAQAMASAGVRDILIANQIVNPYWVECLLQVARICDLKVAVDSAALAQQLSAAAEHAGVELGAVVEVDVNMGRCGCPPGEPACQLAHLVAGLPHLRLRGFMGYEGHAVGIEDPGERARVCREAMAQLVGTAKRAREQGLPVEIVSAGGTGTHDVAGRYPGVTEVQAGSYALMDLQYRRVVPGFEHALTILSTVISRPTASRAVTDAGLKSMSTEFGLPAVTGLSGVVLEDLSEEHGILRIEDPQHPLAPGARVQLYPSHGCTTVNLHRRLYLVRDGKVSGVWAIDGVRGG